jgi:hypothetical protein
VLGVAAAVRAEPLALQQISADARWAANLDMDAFNNSSLPRKARQAILEKHPEAEKHLSMVCDVWNFDPRTDLHGITIYGTRMKRNTGVAIVHAKVDKKMLLDKVQMAPNHSSSKYGEYELHSWTHAQGSKRERAMTGTFYKPDVMVFGASADDVKAALDVLDGKKANFTAKETGLSLSIPAGAIFVAGAAGMGDIDLPCKSPLAKQADAIVVAVGETQGDVFVVGQVLVKKTEAAQQIKTAIDGGLALALLANVDDAEAAKIINAVKVSLADKAVNVEWRAPVDAVWAHAQKTAAKAKEAYRHWREHNKAGSCPSTK